MKEYLESISRDLLITTMKSFFWLLPIGLITNKMYCDKYGAYNIVINDLEKMAKALLSYSSLYAFIVFFSILSIAVFLEKYLLPFIFSKSGKIIKPHGEKIRNSVRSLLKDENLDRVEAVKENIIKEGSHDLYAYFLFLPIGILLWAFYFIFNKLALSLSLMAIALVLMYVIMKSVNTIRHS